MGPDGDIIRVSLPPGMFQKQGGLQRYLNYTPVQLKKNPSETPTICIQFHSRTTVRETPHPPHSHYYHPATPHEIT